MALDLFIANRDRLPTSLHVREGLGEIGAGNSGNLFITADQHLVGIDHIFGLRCLLELNNRDIYIEAADATIRSIIQMDKVGILTLECISGFIGHYSDGYELKFPKIGEIRTGFIKGLHDILAISSNDWVQSLTESISKCSNVTKDSDLVVAQLGAYIEDMIEVIKKYV